MVAEPANKGFTYADCNNLQILINISYRMGTSSLVCLSEVWRSFPWGLMFLPFSPYYEEFNEKIIQMNTAGLTSFWYRDSMRRRYSRFEKRTKPPDIAPQVLTMEHLEVAFIACLVPLVASILVFIIEVSILMVNNFAHNLAMLCFFRLYMNQQSSL